jgi:hypothetical protein
MPDDGAIRVTRISAASFRSILAVSCVASQNGEENERDQLDAAARSAL